MSVVQTFTYSVEAPKTFTSEDAWAKTLSTEEQTAYQTAFLAQRTLVQAQIAAGNLVEKLDPGLEWTWKDQASADAFVWDANYKAIFDRYLAATGMTFNLVTTTK